MINLKNILNEKLARGLKPLLVIGTTISKKTGEDTLVKLSDKFDRIDDEYAGDIASHLDMAIELMQDGYPGDATKMLKQFNKKCKEVLKGKSVGSVFENVVLESVLRGQLAGDSALDMADLLRQYGVKKILKQPNDSVTYLQLTDKSKGNKVVAMLKKMFGIKAQIDNNMYSPTPAVKFDNDQIAESKLTEKVDWDAIANDPNNPHKNPKKGVYAKHLKKRKGVKEGFADKYKSKSEMSPLTQYLRAFMDWLWATQEDALDVAGNYEDQDEPKLAKDWIQFSTILIVSYKKLRNFKEKFAARTKAVLPTSIQKKLDNAKFHKGPTTEDNYKKVLKEVLMLVKEIEKIK